MQCVRFQNGSNAPCKEVGSIGCIYQELLEEIDDNPNTLSLSIAYAKKEKFSIQLSPTSNKAEEVDIEVCTKGCSSLFPYDSFSYFGVRWDEMNAIIECWCLTSDAFDESMVGPQVKTRYLP